MFPTCFGVCGIWLFVQHARRAFHCLIRYCGTAVLYPFSVYSVCLLYPSPLYLVDVSQMTTLLGKSQSSCSSFVGPIVKIFIMFCTVL